MITFQEVIKEAKIHNHNLNEKRVRKAFDIASKLHEGQKRNDGGPYIKHPLNVALLIAKLKLDEDTIVAAFLHDCIEDTNCTGEEIEKNFGKDVRFLVEGVTKLHGIQFAGETGTIENLRKMFLAMAADIRVVLLRLSDRLDNLKTLGVFSVEKRKRIATQTLEVFAPLAGRLGIGALKGELEDRAFKWFSPKEHSQALRIYGKAKKAREKQLEFVMKDIENELKNSKTSFLGVHGRAKHLYSFWQKLKRYENDISKVYDLLAIRIIVKDIPSCYKVLGVLHQVYTPLPGRIKDYIAIPKPNGYRSLHTTVFCKTGEIIEFQIKTQEMHEQAEWGVAAHIGYKEGDKGESRAKLKERTDFISKLALWQKDIENLSDFKKFLKEDVLKNRIFILTPTGDVIDLPEDATPVDFAYEIHSFVGNHARGAKVDGRIVGLKTKLKNGETVEILIEKNSHPSRDWLSFVKTAKARNHIRGYFKEQDRGTNKEEGIKILTRELRLLNLNLGKNEKRKIEEKLNLFSAKNFEDLLVSLGEGALSAEQIINKTFKPEVKVLGKQEDAGIAGKVRGYLRLPFAQKNTNNIKDGVEVEGEKGLKTEYAKCCEPKFGDEILGYVTLNSGVKVHKANCKNIKNKNKKRLVIVRWVGEKLGLVPIEFIAKRRNGLLRDIGKVASDLGLGIYDLNSNSTSKENSVIKFKLHVEHFDQLYKFLREAKEIEGVKKVNRS